MEISMIDFSFWRRKKERMDATRPNKVNDHLSKAIENRVIDGSVSGAPETAPLLHLSAPSLLLSPSTELLMRMKSWWGLLLHINLRTRPAAGSVQVMDWSSQIFQMTEEDVLQWLWSNAHLLYSIQLSQFVCLSENHWWHKLEGWLPVRDIMIATF